MPQRPQGLAAPFVLGRGTLRQAQLWRPRLLGKRTRRCWLLVQPLPVVMRKPCPSGSNIRSLLPPSDLEGKATSTTTRQATPQARAATEASPRHAVGLPASMDGVLASQALHPHAVNLASGQAASLVPRLWVSRQHRHQVTGTTLVRRLLGTGRLSESFVACPCWLVTAIGPT